jgi:hypothetical protein
MITVTTPFLMNWPSIDQYDFVCTTQVLWVNEGAIDPRPSGTPQERPEIRITLALFLLRAERGFHSLRKSGEGQGTHGVVG